MKGLNPKASKAKIRDTILYEKIESCRRALEDEIKACKKQPGRKYEINEGKLVYSGKLEHLYSFKSDITIPVPPETPIELQIRHKEPIQGIFVSQDDFGILLHFDSRLNEGFENSKISVKLWFIYECLDKRLEDLLDEKCEDTYLPAAVLKLKKIKKTPSHKSKINLEALLQELAEKGNKPNDSQLEAIQSSIENPLHFVWGPPGTGKTSNLAQICRALSYLGEKIMILSHSNAAVDAAILKITDVFKRTQQIRDGRILRLGFPQLPEAQDRQEVLPEHILSRIYPDLIELKRELEAEKTRLIKLLSLKQTGSKNGELAESLKDIRHELVSVNIQIKEAINKIIQDAQVLATTFSKLVVDDPIWNWGADAIIIDEISMITFPHILAAALKAKKRLILIGDFRQLPPIFLADTPVAKKWLSRDAFEISGIKNKVESGEFDLNITLLDIQYRMTSSIAHIVNQLSYWGLLKNDQNTDKRNQPIADLAPCEGSSLILVDTTELYPVCVQEPQKGSYSRLNIIHSILGISLAKNAIDDGCTDLALITPYRAQAKIYTAAKRLISEKYCDIATIHRFQGSERDIAIIDLVDAPFAKGASKLTGNDHELSLRLLNVAISRPKGKLIILANAGFVESQYPRRASIRKLIRYIRQHGKTILANDLFSSFQNTTLPFQWYNGWGKIQKSLIDDLSHASPPVLMNLLEKFEPSKELQTSILENAHKSKNITICAPFRIAERFENSEARIQLLNISSGFLARLGDNIAYLGGFDEMGTIVKVSDENFLKTIFKILLGK